jgi:type IX secretion system substrate protein/glycosyl hydrolase family 26
MDGPIRRMLFPQNVEQNYHTIKSAVDELFEVVQMWRDSIPGIEINLLTNFPNWAWGSTPAYVKKAGKSTGYGQYMDVMAAVRRKSAETGLSLSAVTIDNPYNYAIGAANTNQPTVIQGVDWMQRIDELADTVRSMGLKVNMIFNTNSGGDAQGYSEQSLALIDLYHDKVGKPDGYWIQSWYQLPGEWLPETTPYTMTNLTKEAITKIRPDQSAPDDPAYWGLRNINMQLPETVYQDWNPQYLAWGFSWDRVERTDDSYNWATVDQLVDFTAQRGAKSVLLFTPKSAWASDGEPRAPNDLDRTISIDDPVPANGYTASLYDYVYSIVDRIAKRNPSVLGYLRYGNEPQYPDHWITTEQTYPQDVEDYIRCLRTAYLAAHKAASDNNAEIKVSHGGFYYYAQLERIWFEYGEANPAAQDSLLTLFNSHFERQWPKPITTWENFKRRQTTRTGIPPTYWMDAIAGQTEWLDWFDIHYHFKPRYIYDDMRAFEKAVLDSGGTLKPWLAAEAAMQIEEQGETEYEERFHAGDMVRKWITGIDAGLEAICTPVLGYPPDRFFGLYSERGTRYQSANAYAFVHSLIEPREAPEKLSSDEVAVFRFNESRITDVIWYDALFDWMTDVKAFALPVPGKYANRLPGELKAKHYDILGLLVDTYTVDEEVLNVSVAQEPIIIVWEYKIEPSGGELAKYEPPDGYIYHGVGWNYRNSVPLYLQMMPEDQQPLMLQTMSAIPGTRGLTVDKVFGGLNHQWQDPDKQYVEYGVHFHKTQDEPYDSVFAYTTVMDHYIDTLAMGFKQHGKPFFLRIGGEMNGAWNNYSPYAYPAAFRKLVLELRARGVDNFATIWCYEPAAPEDYADSTSRGWKWYPGDDVVDWFGIDVFPSRDFDPNEPDTSRNGQRTPKAKSETFLKFAREKGKPVYIAETTAHSEHIIPDAQDPNLDEGEKIWNHWFVPYFQFLENHPEIKAFNYINLDWTPISKWSHWGDARLEINTYIREHWIAELSKPKYIHKGFDLGNPVLSVEPGYQLVPQSTLLYQNYPNPFNPSTVIPYKITEAGNVKISVYNTQGTEVGELKNQYHEAGDFVLHFNAAHLPAGMYICRMQTGSKVYSIKTILAK